MSKARQPAKKKTSKTAKINRNPRPAPKARLFALEGAGESEISQAASRLAALCGGPERPGCSRWDASNTFLELRLTGGKRTAPPVRTLLLLYASDLLFRLRWEIRPALAQGRTVIAAPYVETAIAFGQAAGLPMDWLEELFSFAPRPDLAFRAKEKARPKDKQFGVRFKSAAGFVEFCTALMAANSTQWNPLAVRNAVLDRFDHLEDTGKLHRLGKKAHKALQAL
ncbi:MAG TPA: hypothetical protein VMH28_20850 [Candidatus Acidoferrales bacterium]|nr:hypothetical protein [Candidatus Acidoferrales bacterium]